MKKFQNSILVIFLILSSVMIYSPSSSKAIENQNITTPEKFTSKDRVLVGKTLPNAYVAIDKSSYFGPDLRNTQYGLVAKADDKGNFKIFTSQLGYDLVGKTISLITLSNNWDVIEIDKIYVYHGAYHQVMAKINEVTGQSVKNTKIEVLKEGITIASGVTDNTGKFSIKIPPYPIGTFLTIKFTNSQGTDVYQEMIEHDWAASGEVIFNPITSWANSISGISIPNCNLVFYNRDTFKVTKVVAVDSEGHFKFDLDNTLPISKLDWNRYRLYERSYENGLNNSYETLILTPTTPKINPISQLSTCITGWAPPESNVSAIDESGNIIGQGTADISGKYYVPVQSLTSGELITIKASMPNTDKTDETMTDVEKVYVENITDDVETINGNSTFGTSAIVTVVSNDSNLRATYSKLKLSSKPKTFGPFKIQKGQTFHLKTGVLKAGSKVKITLLEGNKKLNLPEKTVKQVITPPIKASQVTVKNNRGKSDLVTVKGITKGTLVKLYSSKGKLIASTKSKGTTANLSVQQLGSTKGKLYVTVTRTSLKESKRVTVNYLGEKKGK